MTPRHERPFLLTVLLSIKSIVSFTSLLASAPSTLFTRPGQRSANCFASSTMGTRLDMRRRILKRFKVWRER
jgi:hypothetical protein